MFKKILWVTDFSEHARHAGQNALLCAECSTGVIYALSVVDPEDLPLILEGIPDPFITPEQEDELEQRLEGQYEQRVLEHLKNEIKTLGKTDIAITPQLRVGTPWQEILRAADELNATLIVLGSHGKRSVVELLLGSTVEHVIHHANCPVLVVR